MRKVLVVLMGLILAIFMVSCSKDSGTSTKPQPGEFQISTTSLPDAYFCTPYNTNLQATGGREPYVWDIAVGSDPLPTGLAITADGVIRGILEGAGEHTFTVSCTDNSDPPVTIEQELTLVSTEPSNPSMAVFFDDGADVCMANTQAFQTLDCYVFIMTEDSDIECTRACEFIIRLTDADGADLDWGSDFYVAYVSDASEIEHVAIIMGDPFINGMAISFNRPMFAPDPVHVATFGLTLMQNLDELVVRFEPYPGGHLGVATCDQGYPTVDVSGRKSAINY